MENAYLVAAGIGRDSKRYDCIPDECLSGYILDLGASLGINQLGSKHKEKFLLAVREDRYTGIEAFMPLEPLLPITEGNIMEYQPDRKFDLILLMDVIEHIQFRDWFILFPRLKEWLQPNGILILTTPYKESITGYLHHQGYYSCHVVFNISRDIISRFLPGARFENSQYMQKRIIWRDKDESHLWALMRFIKRRLTGHRHGRILKRRKRLNVFWKKETP